MPPPSTQRIQSRHGRRDSLAQAIWFGGLIQQVGKAELPVHRAEQIVLSVGRSTWARHARLVWVPVWTDRPVEDCERCVIKLTRRAPGITLQVRRQDDDAQRIGWAQ